MNIYLVLVILCAVGGLLAVGYCGFKALPSLEELRVRKYWKKYDRLHS